MLEDSCQRLEQQPGTTDPREIAVGSVGTVLVVSGGIDLTDLTAEAVLLYAEQPPGYTGAATVWPILHTMGQFPSWVPSTPHGARIREQQSIEDVVL